MATLTIEREKVVETWPGTEMARKAEVWSQLKSLVIRGPRITDRDDKPLVTEIFFTSELLALLREIRETNSRLYAHQQAPFKKPFLLSCVRDYLDGMSRRNFDITSRTTAPPIERTMNMRSYDSRVVSSSLLMHDSGDVIFFASDTTLLCAQDGLDQKNRRGMEINTFQFDDSVDDPRSTNRLCVDANAVPFNHRTVCNSNGQCAIISDDLKFISLFTLQPHGLTKEDHVPLRSLPSSGQFCDPFFCSLRSSVFFAMSTMQECEDEEPNSEIREVDCSGQCVQIRMILGSIKQIVPVNNCLLARLEDRVLVMHLTSLNIVTEIRVPGLRAAMDLFPLKDSFLCWSEDCNMYEVDLFGRRRTTYLGLSEPDFVYASENYLYLIDEDRITRYCMARFKRKCLS
jgi:hypothetical protein